MHFLRQQVSGGVRWNKISTVTRVTRCFRSFLLSSLAIASLAVGQNDLTVWAGRAAAVASTATWLLLTSSMVRCVPGFCSFHLPHGLHSPRLSLATAQMMCLEADAAAKSIEEGLPVAQMPVRMLPHFISLYVAFQVI